MVKVAYTVRNLHGKLLHRIRIIPDQDDRVLLFFYSTFQISSITSTILFDQHLLCQDCSGNVGRSFTHVPTWSCHVTIYELDACMFGWLVRFVAGSWRSTVGWFVWEKNTVPTENLRSFTTSHSQTNKPWLASVTSNRASDEDFPWFCVDSFFSYVLCKERAQRSLHSLGSGWIFSLLRFVCKQFPFL